MIISEVAFRTLDVVSYLKELSLLEIGFAVLAYSRFVPPSLLGWIRFSLICEDNLQ